ncbi:hypothetical protein [Roseicella frigidaeris]|uniref:Argininosuccinate lyase n=1 Tax=Roseicella frigidaeris TaxID=2230885 RepID=A0A327ME82_9PROT|nr:hypothetical protein [Roseicella frigidaeris]RAI60977.1 hypothetical protein DOO78_02285 [Roseicella frigidaeris]
MPGLPILLLAAALLLAACDNQPPSRSLGSTPIGTDASTGRPSLSQAGAGPGGINLDYRTGGDPNFPAGRSAGSRGIR